MIINDLIKKYKQELENEKDLVKRFELNTDIKALERTLEIMNRENKA